MDFSTFDFGLPKEPTKTETTVSVELVHDGKPVKGPGGKQVVFDMLAPGSPEATKELRKWRIKWGIANDDDMVDATEDALAEAVDREDASGVDLAVRLVVGWNIVEGKTSVECSRDNRRALFAAHGALAGIAVQQYRKQANKMGN